MDRKLAFVRRVRMFLNEVLHDLGTVEDWYRDFAQHTFTNPDDDDLRPADWAQVDWYAVRAWYQPTRSIRVDRRCSPAGEFEGDKEAVRSALSSRPVGGQDAGSWFHLPPTLLEFFAPRLENLQSVNATTVKKGLPPFFRHLWAHTLRMVSKLRSFLTVWISDQNYIPSIIFDSSQNCPQSE